MPIVALQYNSTIRLYYEHGLVAEWLGTGLQNHVQRFESARDLTIQEKYFITFLLKYHLEMAFISSFLCGIFCFNTLKKNYLRIYL